MSPITRAKGQLQDNIVVSSPRPDLGETGALKSIQEAREIVPRKKMKKIWQELRHSHEASRHSGHELGSFPRWILEHIPSENIELLLDAAYGKFANKLEQCAPKVLNYFGKPRWYLVLFFGEISLSMARILQAIVKEDEGLSFDDFYAQVKDHRSERLKSRSKLAEDGSMFHPSDFKTFLKKMKATYAMPGRGITSDASTIQSQVDLDIEQERSSGVNQGTEESNTRSCYEKEGASEFEGNTGGIQPVYGSFPQINQFEDNFLNGLGDLHISLEASNPSMVGLENDVILCERITPIRATFVDPPNGSMHDDFMTTSGSFPLIQYPAQQYLDTEAFSTVVYPEAVSNTAYTYRESTSDTTWGKTTSPETWQYLQPFAPKLQAMHSKNEELKEEEAKISATILELDQNTDACLQSASRCQAYTSGNSRDDVMREELFSRMLSNEKLCRIERRKLEGVKQRRVNLATIIEICMKD